MTESELMNWLCLRVAELAPVEAERISSKEPLATYGMRSADAVLLAGELSRRLGRSVPPTVVYEYPTLEELVGYLTGKAEGRAVGSTRMKTEGGSSEPIAIVGMGCRFPGAKDVDGLWELLRTGGDAIGRVPGDRFGLRGGAETEVGGFVSGMGGLDLDFFGIGEQEAARMDPQQRLLLEVAWEALHDAGIDPRTLAGSRSGVFMGISTSDYRTLLEGSPSVDAYSLLGNASSVAANRLSYLLDLRGPSLSIDTACSSSLVAVHLACEAIRRGECDMAIVGGVNAILSPSITRGFASSGVMAPDARCKTFSDRADGYVRSEGAGVVVLKRLGDAIEAEDDISALICGTAVNADGRTNGLLAPSRKAQEAVIRQAMRKAGVVARDVAYVEAHGTGTAIGDQIEALALGATVGRDRSADRPCAVGSIKTNLGHLEAAAGIAGLMKVALSFERKALPASLHCEVLNPAIDFEGLGLRVSRSLEAWGPLDGTVAGVSSFGFGGANAHAVVGPPPAQLRSTLRAHSAHVLAVSAGSQDALRVLQARHAEWVERLGDDELPSAAAYATWVGGHAGLRGREHRAAIVFETKAELLERLRSPSMRPLPIEPDSGVVFVFPGQGGQWLGMGRTWLGNDSAFDLAISRCEEAFAPYVSWSLPEILSNEACAAELERLDVVQPAIFAMQVGLASVFRSWGIRPVGVIGHSMGEVAAAHVAGALRIEDAARIICRRSALMARHRGEGTMALVSMPAAELRSWLDPYREDVALAAHNGPRTSVLSGRAAAVDEVLAKMEGAGIFCRRIKVDVASHCALLDDLESEVMAELAGIAPRRQLFPFYSSVTGLQFDTEGLTAEYWWRNLRQPVRFADAVASTRRAGHRMFLELSPHPLLAVSVAECFEESDSTVVAVPAMRRTDERAPHEAVAALYEAGYPVDWSKYFGGRPGQPSVRAPTYPWQQQVVWADSAVASPAGGHSGLTDDVRLVTGGLPVIEGHVVQGRSIAPAAWMLDFALGELNPTGASDLGLREVIVTSPLAVAADERRHVRVCRRARGAESVLVIESRSADDREAPWAEHASALWSPTARRSGDVIDLDQVRARCTRRVEPGVLYGHLAASQLAYSEGMRTVQDIWLGDGEVLTALAAPSSETAGGWLPPDVVDGAMQSIAATTLESGGRGTFLGFGYRRVDAFEKWSGPSFAHVRVRGTVESDADSFDCDVQILSPEGAVLVELEQVSLKRARQPHEVRFFAVELSQRSLPPETIKRQAFVVLAPDVGEAESLAGALRGAGHTCDVLPLPSSEDVARLLEARPDGACLVCVEPPRDAFFALIRAAAGVASTTPRELAVITSDPSLPPLLQALEQEAVGWRGRAIRIPKEEIASAEAARNVAAELGTPPDACCVHYQRGERLVPMMAPIESPPEPVQLRPRGVFWLTGGQGGLGSTLALALAREAGARIVITGRRDAVDPALQTAVEEVGGELLYIQADVTDRAAMKQALDLVLARFGALDGVVHTAGILDDALLQSTSVERLEAILDPKERGAQVLLDVVATEDLDFIVLFSSFASLFVTPGQGAYAAGNATLDTMAGRKLGRRAPVKILNWGPWAELGMVKDERYQRQFLEMGIHPLIPEEGAEAFLRALQSPFDQLAILDVRHEVAGELALRFNRALGAARARSDGVRGPADDKSPVDWVRSEIARALRRDPSEIDTGTRFDRLGVDSLLAVSVTRKIGSHYGIELPATFMFSHPTVDAVALYVSDVVGIEPSEDATEASPPEAGPGPSALEVALDEDGRHSVVPGYTVVGTESGFEMRLQVVPVEKPGPMDVVIDVRAVGVNFIDVLASTGFHPFLETPPFVPGHEVGGVVLAVGEAVSHVEPGEEVIALVPRGGYATRVTTASFTVAPLPSNASIEEATSLLVSGLTAIACLERDARVRPGSHVLVQAAAGATGTACVQLALHHGAVVYGTASTEVKLDHLRRLGVHHPINYVERDFVDAVREVAPEGGLDLVVDSLSGDAVRKGLGLLRPGGRLVEIGAAGVLDLAVDGRELFMRSRSFSTVNLGALARDPSELVSLLRRMSELVEAGALRPNIGGVYELEDATEAIAQLRNRANIGKLVVRID